MSIDLLRAAVAVEVHEDGTAIGRTDIGGVERGGLFGGQLVAQALSAAGAGAPAGSVPDSIHANLVGASQIGEPVVYRVERVRDGRALQHRDVRAEQGGRLILHATVVSSIAADGVDWQQPVIPEAGKPVTGPGAPPSNLAFLSWDLFDIALSESAVARTPGTHPLWLRSRIEVPDDPWLWGAIHVFWSDLGLNGAARTTHQEVAGETSSVSATHAVWLHRRTVPSEWHLFDVEPFSLSGNQGFVRASLFHESGALVASVSQGVFIRRPTS